MSINTGGVFISKLNICVLASGSSGNAIYVATEKKKLLIDAGLSGKEVNKRLNQVNVEVDEIDAIFLTHEHSDHIQGAGVISRRCDVPIYASQGTWQGANDKLGKLTSANKNIITKEDVILGDMKITPFSISHDAKQPFGYSICYQDSKLAVATDTGEITSEVKDAVKGAELVVLESNHDLEMLKIGPYPWSLKKRVMSAKGHLSNDDAGAAVVDLVKNSTTKILLAHLSQDNNIPELAYLTIKNMLADAGMEIDKDLQLDFACQNQVSKLYQI